MFTANLNMDDNTTALAIDAIKAYREISLDAGAGHGYFCCEDSDPIGTPNVETNVWKYADSMIEDISHDRPLTGDQLLSLFTIIDDAINDYHVAGERVGLLHTDEQYDMAVTLLAKLTDVEHDDSMRNYRLLPVLADALRGHYGASVVDTALLGDSANNKDSVRRYADEHGMQMFNWLVCLAWAMAILNVREVNDDVTDVAIELAEVF